MTSLIKDYIAKQRADDFTISCFKLDSRENYQLKDVWHVSPKTVSRAGDFKFVGSFRDVDAASVILSRVNDPDEPYDV